MKENIKYILGFGIGLVVLKFLVQYLVGTFCEGGGLGCAAMILLFETPGLALGNVFGLSYNISGIINIPVYFIIGGIIGLIIHKIRNK